MKQRFSSLDVKIIAHELSNRLVSLRLSNVYDLSSRIYLLKFAKPNHREQLLIDSGFRCHLTNFARATAAAPSVFVAKLRKYLRTRRVTSVVQIGTDRVIEIQFSDGAFRLLLEFYAGGNIILTNNDYEILTLWRTVSEGAEHELYRAGNKYDITHRQNYDGVPDLTKERVKDGLQKAILRQEQEANKPGKKIKRKPGDALRRALATTTFEFPPILIDHALAVSSFDKETAPEKVIEDEGVLDNLMLALDEAAKVIKAITSQEQAKGYIIAKPKTVKTDTTEDQADARHNLAYDDFHPFKPAQLAADNSLVFLEHDGFNKAVDDFFSSIEGQKLESRLQEREDNAKRKIEQARQEQANRIDGLLQVQELNVRKAQAIEANVERVEEAIEAVNGLIAQGMDWTDMSKLIENEQARHNAVAEMIKLPLKLEENTISLMLSEIDGVEEEMADETDSEASDSDDEKPTKSITKAEDKRLVVDIDLALSPWSNARSYYENRRAAASKQEKTALASDKALKSTEQKVMADLKKGLKQEKDILRPVRKQFWFEKFIYFISSDGYLVLAGKDAQQSEILYRRYLKKGDIYVHADLPGAASVIIKNQPTTPDAPIPPSTLSQAGSLSVCTSNAWDSKAVMSAWWVTSDQVSKTAATGEYLTSGGFTIKGKKNFLPPAQLLLGFAVVFQISEESKAKHIKHRVRDVDEVRDEVEKIKPDENVEDHDDDDDEFPDVDDDDDEFPDANGAQHNDSEEYNEKLPARSNPLQTKKQDDEPMDEQADDMDESDSTEAANEDADAATIASITDQKTSVNGSSSAPSAKSAPKVRGKKGKAKKIATKYANQDKEDRELAMRLLGSKAADEKRQEEAAAMAEKTETPEEARARRKAQHEKTQKAGLEAEQLRRLQLEEGGEELDDEETNALTQLDALVGTPLPGDVILEAFPVCAPWTALTKYKYKVKLQPGQQKKGKAVREILGRWSAAGSNVKALDQHSQDTEKIWPREAELIKGWKDTEVNGIIPVKSVRVVMSGGSAGADKGKSGRGIKSGRGGRGSKKSK